MQNYYIWFGLFAVISYIIISDKNTSAAFVYIVDIAKIGIRKRIWWLKNNPSNPIVKYLMWHRSIKLAKELQKELTNKN